MGWIIDAYSLVFAALLLPAGALGDRYGRRRALIVGLVIFGGASAVAMTASSANELIILRGVIGLGAALVMLATLSTITGTFAPAERTRAVSVWAAVAGGAALLGRPGHRGRRQHRHRRLPGQPAPGRRPCGAGQPRPRLLRPGYSRWRPGQDQRQHGLC